MVPCLNDSDDHIKLLKNLIENEIYNNELLTYFEFKSLHLISVISWMAGFLYLPRIFFYHAENNSEKKINSEIFKIMERKLFLYIMTPAMILSWIFWIF